MKVYLDEIEAIAELLERHSPGNVEIASEVHIFDDVDDLRNLRRRTINSLTVKSDEPTISVVFAPGSATIQSPDPSAANRGVIADIEELLKPCRRWLWSPVTYKDAARRSEVRNYSTIVLRRRAEAHGFFVRKRDDILLLAIGGLIGSGLTIATDVIVSRL